jgi:alkylhydroperoxidase/carboxymuconolactone decarboxylase family protein YurZ
MSAVPLIEESLEEVMAPGALDPLTKELIYLAVGVANRLGRRVSGAGGRAVRKPVLIKAHSAGASPEAIGAPMIAV